MKCQICSRTRLSARICGDCDNFAYVAGSVADPNMYNDRAVDNAWCLDSRMSHHMTPTVGAMTDVQLYEGNLAIIVGDGKVLRVTHTDNVRLIIGDEWLDLKNTLLFPN